MKKHSDEEAGQAMVFFCKYFINNKEVIVEFHGLLELSFRSVQNLHCKVTNLFSKLSNAEFWIVNLGLSEVIKMNFKF